MALPPARNHPDVPLISIIVVCRNPGEQLRTTIASVRAQRDADCELVIVDGGSTDGTRAWLEAEHPAIGTLITEPDHGIYDAMNKGIAAARGDWVLFLGADDQLAASDTLAQAAQQLVKHSDGVLAGTARFDDGRIYSPSPTTAVRRNFVHHQGTFYRRTLFQRHGRFDLSLRIQADYDFNLRLLRAGVAFTPLPLLISDCASGGVSDAGHWANYREEITVRHRHFPAWRCWPWDAAAVARWLRKQLLRPSRSHG
ncbi:MAG: glycosyltransferase [Opitutaceae bacterium]|nr:glycosyltransferase [Opitutaceae bacterium]